MSEFESTEPRAPESTAQEFRPPEPGPPEPKPIQPESKPPKSKTALTALVIALIVLVAIGCGVFIYWQLTRGFTEPPSRAPLAAPPPPATAPPPPEIDLPPLEESDELVRAALEGLSEHPRFAAWLLPDRLVSRFVAAVDNVSRGKSPRTHLRFLKPGGEFRSREREGELTMDPASFARYDRLTEVFLSLDTKTGVRLYRQLEPLFKKAYQELGYPQEDFDKALAGAIDHLLSTPIPQGPVEIERRITGFRYRDPNLEDLTPAQKHYLRLGPENARQIHAKLRLMQTALGLTEAQRQAP